MDNSNQRPKFQSMLEGVLAPADNSIHQNWSPAQQGRARLDSSAGQDTSSLPRLNMVPVSTIGRGAHTASTSTGTGIRFADEAAGRGSGVQDVQDIILHDIEETARKAVHRPAQPSLSKVSRLINSTLGTQAFSYDQESYDGPSGSQPAVQKSQDAGISASNLNNPPHLADRWPVYRLNSEATPIPEKEAQQPGAWAAAGAAAADAPLLPYDRGREMGLGGTDSMEDDNAMGALNRKRNGAFGQPHAPVAGQHAAWYPSGNAFGTRADGALRPASPNVEDAQLLLTFSGGHPGPRGMFAPQDRASGFGPHHTQHQPGGSQPQWAGSADAYPEPSEAQKEAYIRRIQAVAAEGVAAAAAATTSPFTTRGLLSSAPTDALIQLKPVAALQPKCSQLYQPEISQQPMEPWHRPAAVEVGVLNFCQNDGSRSSRVVWGVVAGVFDPERYIQGAPEYIRLLNFGPPVWVSRGQFERINSGILSKCIRSLRVLGPAASLDTTVYSQPVNPLPHDGHSAALLECLDDWMLRHALPLGRSGPAASAERAPSRAWLDTPPAAYESRRAASGGFRPTPAPSMAASATTRALETQARDRISHRSLTDTSTNTQMPPAGSGASGAWGIAGEHRTRCSDDGSQRESYGSCISPSRVATVWGDEINSIGGNRQMGDDGAGSEEPEL